MIADQCTAEIFPITKNLGPALVLAGISIKLSIKCFFIIPFVYAELTCQLGSSALGGISFSGCTLVFLTWVPRWRYRNPLGNCYPIIFVDKLGEGLWLVVMKLL